MGKLIETIIKCFDDFVISARIKPAITAVFPMLIMAVYKGIVNSEWSDAGIGLALFLVVISFVAYIIQEFGRTYEEKMFKELGNMPSTIILRFSDVVIDNVTKIRYHNWLNLKIPELNLPLSAEEEIADEQSDDKYGSAIKYLRVYANSHRDELPRVYQELKKYHYWRNLYGVKWYVLIVYAILIIREIVKTDVFSVKQLFLQPFPEYSILFLLLTWSVIFCLIVTKKTVKRNAFDYAKTLLETVDSISMHQ